MTEPAPFSGRRAPILFGLLFLVAILALVVVWVPIAACPTCGGAGSVMGPARLVLEEGRRTRKPSPSSCPDCDGGRISVIKRWRLGP